MEAKSIDYFLTQGVFCVLFVLLAIWAKGFIERIMDENKRREAEYRATLAEYRSTLDKFGDIIQVDLQTLKSEVRVIGGSKER